MNCVFCKIVNGGIPSYSLYEDDKIKVFLDINPKSNGHTLIVPKEHFVDLDDISLEMVDYIFSKAKDIKKLLETKLNPDGIRLVQNNGVLEDVKHFHLHIIPFYKENNLKDVKEIYEILNMNWTPKVGQFINSF